MAAAISSLPVKPANTVEDLPPVGSLVTWSDQLTPTTLRFWKEKRFWKENSEKEEDWSGPFQVESAGPDESALREDRGLFVAIKGPDGEIHKFRPEFFQLF